MPYLINAHTVEYIILTVHILIIDRVQLVILEEHYNKQLLVLGC